MIKLRLSECRNYIFQKVSNPVKCILLSGKKFFTSVFKQCIIQRKYQKFLGSDKRIVSGESGAVCVGALIEICRDKKYEKMKMELGLDKNSRVLIISTEGDTDKEGFDKIVGR